MAAQATIPSKTLNQHRWRKQNIPEQNQIQTLSIYQPSLTEYSGRKNPTQGRLKKGQNIKHFKTN